MRLCALLARPYHLFRLWFSRPALFAEAIQNEGFLSADGTRHPSFGVHCADNVIFGPARLGIVGFGGRRRRNVNNGRPHLDHQSHPDDKEEDDIEKEDNF